MVFAAVAAAVAAAVVAAAVVAAAVVAAAVAPAGWTDRDSSRRYFVLRQSPSRPPCLSQMRYSSRSWRQPDRHPLLQPSRTR